MPFFGSKSRLRRNSAVSEPELPPASPGHQNIPGRKFLSPKSAADSSSSVDKDPDRNINPFRQHVSLDEGKVDAAAIISSPSKQGFFKSLKKKKLSIAFKKTPSIQSDNNQQSEIWKLKPANDKRNQFNKSQSLPERKDPPAAAQPHHKIVTAKTQVVTESREKYIDSYETKMISVTARKEPDDDILLENVSGTKNIQHAEMFIEPSRSMPNTNIKPQPLRIAEKPVIKVTMAHEESACEMCPQRIDVKEQASFVVDSDAVTETIQVQNRGRSSSMRKNMPLKVTVPPVQHSNSPEILKNHALTPSEEKFAQFQVVSKRSSAAPTNGIRNRRTAEITKQERITIEVSQ